MGLTIEIPKRTNFTSFSKYYFMKKIGLLVIVVAFAFSCNKTNDLVKSTSFKKITYEIYDNVDSLSVAYGVGVYTSNEKGNIEHYTSFLIKGTHYIQTELLIGKPVTFYALSLKGNDFHLKIKDTSGIVLIETDTVAFYPANQLHPDEYISRLEYLPQ